MIAFNKISIDDIVQALQLELPERRGHEKMLPPNRKLDIPENAMKKPHKSAVLILLFPIKSQLHICLTVRNKKLRTHPGEISFPGGKIDDGEQEIFQTAIRETEEETGITVENASIIGFLSDIYIPVSNFIISPVIGILAEKPHYNINKVEVERVLTIPLSHLFNEKNKSVEKLLIRGQERMIPCYKFDKEIIWGATAMIISEFETLLSDYYLTKATH
jgi:8-oxo-dGTP pyrophosphatase MutT (NUDIX family)